MNRAEFLAALAKALEAMPQAEIDKTLDYFAEQIDDRVEEGKSEAEAVAELEGVEDIAGRILQSTPLPVLVREKVRSYGRPSALTIVLLVVGSPVWLPLLLAALAILLSFYVVIWALVAVLYAMVLSIAVSGLACLAGGVWLLLQSAAAGLFTMGGGLVLLGLALLCWFPAKAAVKGLVALTVLLARWVRSIFIKRRNVQ